METAETETSAPGSEIQPGAISEMTSLMAQRLPYFRRIALRRVDNMADAEDAVQDAYLSAWKNLHKFKGQAQMSTWLTVIVINAARMTLRKNSRFVCLPLEHQDDETPHLSEILSDTDPDPEEQVRRVELEDRLRRLMIQLRPRLREVIRLRGIDGLSTREAANALGLTESALKTRAARARAALKRLDKINPALGVGTQVPRPAGLKVRRSVRNRKRVAQEKSARAGDPKSRLVSAL